MSLWALLAKVLVKHLYLLFYYKLVLLHFPHAARFSLMKHKRFRHVELVFKLSCTHVILLTLVTPVLRGSGILNCLTGEPEQLTVSS